MKYKFSFCLFIGVALVYFFLPKNKTNDSKQSILLNRVFETVQENHLQTVFIDDAFSKLMFDQFLKKLDPDKLFFTQVDIEKLTGHHQSIDDEIKNGTFQFYEQATTLLRQNIARSAKFCQDEIDKKIDINSREVLELKNEKSSYSKDSTELKDYWRKKIKHNFIHQLSIIEKGGTQTSFEEQKKEALSKVKSYYKNKFKKYKSIDDQILFQKYLDAFLDLHDVQSAYMTPKQNEEWKQKMGRSQTGIGVRLKIVDEYPQFTKITAGGPAWKTKEIEIGDNILKISTDEGIFVDTWGMQMDEFLAYLKGEKGSSVTLHIQKSNGDIKQVEIIRDELKLDLAMSFILNDKNSNRRIGYLMLPRFYGGGEDAGTDVSRELDMLRENKVDGIIFDVRSNRGGYSNIAIDIMSYFLESGVAMQTQARHQARKYLNIENGYLRYKGDLVVLVDGYSASASELFAGTMQDYKRGVVVGGKSTFGKGSMQHFYNLDTEIDGEYLELGRLKLTTARFYTGCGNTPQTKGIIPDIQLPDEEKYIESGERSMFNSIPTEGTKRTICAQTVNKVNNLEYLKLASENRVLKNERFQLAEKKALAIKEQQASTSIPLNYIAYKQYQASKFKAKTYDNKIFAPIPDFEVEVLPQEIAGRDSIEISRDDRWIKKLESDPYVQECYWIMLDCLKG